MAILRVLAQSKCLLIYMVYLVSLHADTGVVLSPSSSSLMCRYQPVDMGKILHQPHRYWLLTFVCSDMILHLRLWLIGLSRPKSTSLHHASLVLLSIEPSWEYSLWTRQHFLCKWQVTRMETGLCLSLVFSYLYSYLTFFFVVSYILA